MVMGVYYFLWIFMAELFVIPFAFHIKTLDQIGRYEGATQRRPNAYLSYFCCCGPSRSAFVSQKCRIDENTDPIAVANNLKRLKNSHVKLSTIVDPHENSIRHL